MAKTRHRIPKLRFTAWRDLGWHVAFRDQETGIPRKHLFNIREREREAEARILYHGWVLEKLGGNGKAYPIQIKAPPRPPRRSDMLSGCILEVATAFKKAEQSRVRQPGGDRVYRVSKPEMMTVQRFAFSVSRRPRNNVSPVQDISNRKEKSNLVF